MKEKIKIVLKRLPQILWSVFQDALLFGGCGVISYGVWRLNAEAGLIVAGVLLVALAFIIAKGERRR